MPFLFTLKNMQSVFDSHLQPGEESVAIVMAGARGVLGLTSNNRILHSNFPFFGQAKILDEYYLSDVFSAQCTQKNTYTMLITLDAKGEKKQYKSTITPHIDSKEMANQFVNKITEKNRNARPAYLGSDEEVIENIVCKDASYTVTDAHLIKLSKTGDLQGKQAWDSFTEFDYYPGKMESMYLYFESKDGSVELLNFKEDSFSIMHQDKEKSSKGIIDNLKQIFNADKMPEYLHQQYPLAVFRAGTSLMGAVNPGHVIKVFEDRIVDLRPNKSGKLEVEKNIPLNTICDFKVIRNKGENSHSDIYELKIKLSDGGKLKYATGSQHFNAIQELRSQLA